MKVHVYINWWISQGSACKVHLRVCQLSDDSGLRVRREGSEQNLRHVLLAKGHEEQCQALIGWIYRTTLKQRKRRGDAFHQQGQHRNTSWRWRCLTEVLILSHPTVSDICTWPWEAVVGYVSFFWVFITLFPSNNAEFFWPLNAFSLLFGILEDRQPLSVSQWLHAIVITQQLSASQCIWKGSCKTRHTRGHFLKPKLFQNGCSHKDFVRHWAFNVLY